jgi:ABC-type branched-subunit amino acid transport system substrate-binding protein
MSGIRTFAMMAVAVTVLIWLPWVRASPGDSEEVRLGMSTALTGPAAQLGLDMRLGVEAAFHEANLAGGIHGRKLRLIVLDDGYEPSRTAPNMHELIEVHEVLAVIGNVGTPTAVAAIPIANTKKTALFGALTGAGVLRKTPPDRYAINYRASYAQETAAMVDALVDEAGVKVEEIAFFTQRDAYGDAGQIGGITAMKRHGLTDDMPIAQGRYQRNTTAVENGLADILDAETPVRAVIMVGSYEPCAEFIRLAREFDFNPIFMNVSFVGSESLCGTLGADGEGVIITQVVPHPLAELPVTKAYLEALQVLDSEAAPTFGSLEGYIAGRIMIDALQSVEGELTRENTVDALEGLGTFDIGLGHDLELGQDRHQACNRVWPTVIRDGRVVPYKWSELQNAIHEAGADAHRR